MLSALLVQPRRGQGYVSDFLLVDQDQSFVAKDSFLGLWPLVPVTFRKHYPRCNNVGSDSPRDQVN